MAQIDLQIRELQTVKNQISAEIRALQTQKRTLEQQHSKRRRCLWNDETPLSRLVNPQQREAYNDMIRQWQKQTTEELIPSKTIHFHFLPDYKWQVFRALSLVLAKNPPVFKVSTLQLCRYLAEHSNLGTVEGIRQALYRANKDDTT